MPARSTDDLPAPFAVDVEPGRRMVSVLPRGELDLAAVPELDAAVGALREAGFREVRLDLRQLTFIDSSGLRLILQLCRDERLDISVVPGPAAIQRVFRLAGLEQEVPFLPAPRAPRGLREAA